MKNLEFNYNEILKEIISRMEAQGAFNMENRESMIDEVLQEKQNAGILPDDFPYKSAHEKLEYMLAEHLKEESAE
ncbi:hypothetical protein KJ782_02925 [Patescibacteria group bacterium]|nr:hypothetical protein [Patescibacteria group bacterium]